MTDDSVFGQGRSMEGQLKGNLSKTFLIFWVPHAETFRRHKAMLLLYEHRVSCTGLSLTSVGVWWARRAGVEEGRQTGNRRQGWDPAFVLDPNPVPEQPAIIQSCLDRCHQKSVTQIQVDPWGLLMCYLV